MATPEKRQAAGAWAALAGLAPLLVFAQGLSTGLVLGITFLVTHSAAAAVALLLPVKLGRSYIFAFSVLAAAVAVSLTASVVRLLDPFLFETTYRYMFLVTLTIPVLGASVMPLSMDDRERAIENLVRGLGFALAIMSMGAIREFLSSGIISVNSRAQPSSLLPFATQPAGAFILIGLVAAGFRAIMRAAKRSEP
jgi:electron transport complex protein RnfE